MSKKQLKPQPQPSYTQHYDVIEVGLAKRDELASAPWASLAVLVEAGLAVRKHVTGADRAPAGMVWLRQGDSKDGILEGRTMLYQQGA